MPICLDRDRGPWSTEVQHGVGAWWPPPASTAAPCQLSSIHAQVALEASLDGRARDAGHCDGEGPRQLRGSHLQTLDGIDHGLKVALDQEVDGALTAQLGVAGMQPDLDAFRPVHVL